MAPSEPSKVYQIKVTLNFIQPPVWRRILVSDKITLLDLHHVIQDVFGWLDYHLHEFNIYDISYGDPANDEFGEMEIRDEKKFKLKKLALTEGSKFIYEYDFGDSWKHTLVVEKILPFEKGMKLPQCIKGKRACPPEDVGGPWGYEGFLEAMQDPQNKEHDQYMEWIGGEFDPEAFDLESVNECLRQHAERNWPGGSTSFVTEGGSGTQKSIFDSNRLGNLFTKEDDNTAEELALRKDAVTFLNYLKENKVTGTKATGNLPRKVIEEIAPRFVKPPVLETKIGDEVFRYHSEDDVWPIYFVHVLTQGADLISGGPNRQWRLTSDGEKFLTLPSAVQVWALFTAWWYQIDWQVAYSYDIFGGEIPSQFSQTAASQLHKMPVDEPQNLESFTDQLIHAMGWTIPQQEADNARKLLQTAIQYMIIGPSEDFGVLTTRYKKEDSPLPGVQRLKSFSLTRFGLTLLGAILTKGAPGSES